MSEETSGSRPLKPQRWWQWVFLYPALAVAVISAAPNWISTVTAWYNNKTVGQMEEANRQIALWTQNPDCAAAPDQFFQTEKKYRIDATICSSGNVLVQLKGPDLPEEGKYHWFDVDQVIADSTKSAALFSSAFASELTPEYQVAQSAFVMCQRFVDQATLLRVINTGGSCVDEVIDISTGTVKSRNASQCRSQC